jgi:hypothetical protein
MMQLKALMNNDQQRPSASVAVSLKDRWAASKAVVQLGRLPILLSGLLVGSALSLAAGFNGFDVSNALVPLNEIRSGGPPRDGIPAIDRPRFVSPGAARGLQADDLVVSVTVGGRARAYPLRILVHHEIVNDQLGGRALAITYCPLCGTAMVFDRDVNGHRLTFGVSGLLYQSSLLMYDRQTDSLWSQVGMQAIAGSQVGVPLNLVASEHLTWEAWRAFYPTGEVLVEPAGSRRNYSRNPYADYERDDRVGYSVPRTRTELPNKEWVVGVLVNGHPTAFPLNALATAGAVRQEVGGILIEVQMDAHSQSVNVIDLGTGQPLPFVKLYWFAWQAFHPQTLLWQP